MSQSNTAIRPHPKTDALLKVLLVEDSLSEQSILAAILKKLEYHVVTANNGEEALEILDNQRIDIILSDWRMPKMDGFSLCQELHSRATPAPYFILLTGRDAKCDLIAAMDAGADDFITKPFNREELRVRLLAGQRIVTMRHTLEQQTQTVAHALTRETETNLQMQRDLKAAEQLQRSLLPNENQDYNGVAIAHYFRAVHGVAGDAFNILPLSETLLAFYHIDVAGHGVRAAMHSFNITRLLTDTSESNRLVSIHPTTRGVSTKAPSTVLNSLNKRFHNDDCQDYYTMIYGVLNVATGKGILSQAGMPHPILQSHDTGISTIGTGGFPIGMLPEASYEDHHFVMKEGDRLTLHSDGLFSCPQKNGKSFGQKELQHLLEKVTKYPLDRLHNCFPELMTRLMGADQADDDISIMMLEKTHYTPHSVDIS